MSNNPDQTDCISLSSGYGSISLAADNGPDDKDERDPLHDQQAIQSKSACFESTPHTSISACQRLK
jgi:hypothetical protein